MKSNRITRITAAVFAVAMIALLAGCSTPIEKAYSTSTIYKAGQADLIALAGRIPQPVFDAAADADKIASPLVAEMNRAAVQAQAESIPLSKAYDFNKAWDAARNAVNTFLVRVTAAKGSGS